MCMHIYRCTVREAKGYTIPKSPLFYGYKPSRQPPAAEDGVAAEYGSEGLKGQRGSSRLTDAGVGSAWGSLGECKHINSHGSLMGWFLKLGVPHCLDFTTMYIICIYIYIYNHVYIYIYIHIQTYIDIYFYHLL